MFLGLACIFDVMEWSVMRISVTPRFRVTSHIASAIVVMVFSVLAEVSTMQMMVRSTVICQPMPLDSVAH